MTIQLPDGLYPFINERLPLSELAMIEAPADLEQLWSAPTEVVRFEVWDIPLLKGYADG